MEPTTRAARNRRQVIINVFSTHRSPDSSVIFWLALPVSLGSRVHYSNGRCADQDQTPYDHGRGAGRSRSPKLHLVSHPFLETADRHQLMQRG
jgi:hypothetical protein